jgi:YegS/Rv2252/BmrU family lipid kinase
MRVVAERTLVVVNPRSRNGVTGRRWDGVEQKLRAALGPLEVERTAGRRDAERIAREAVRAGVDRLVVAGGDGTLSEVATGLLAAGLGGYAEIGVLPLGSGGDFARALGIPRSIDAAIACLASSPSRPVDAVRVSYRDHSGKDATVYCMNVASFGMSGLVVEMVDGASKKLGGTVSYLMGTLRALARHRCRPVSLRVDGVPVFDGPLTFAVAANGRFFGGGMLVAPEARIDDARLEVVIVGALGKARLLARLPAVYRGTYLRDPAVEVHRGRIIEADAPPGEVSLEIDGEPLGTLPARIEVLPGALQLIGPAS